jgi:hypothetical protein
MYFACIVQEQEKEQAGRRKVQKKGCIEKKAGEREEGRMSLFQNHQACPESQQWETGSRQVEENRHASSLLHLHCLSAHRASSREGRRRGGRWGHSTSATTPPRSPTSSRVVEVTGEGMVSRGDREQQACSAQQLLNKQEKEPAE